MSEKVKNFIETIGLLARNEYLGREKWILPSVCIAQAALESGWNLNAKTVFGIKGSGFTATTSEYYNGHYVQIQDSFRAYPNVAAAVVGYYDFLTNTPRYANALNNTDYKDAVDKLIHTTDGAPYATDPNYISKIISIIDQYGLQEYDARENEQPVPEPEQPAPTTAHSVGEVVNYGTIYASSDSDEGLKPTYTSGEITKIIPGARNPYLIGEGTGWINDGCISGEAAATVSEPSSIGVGTVVRVVNSVNYNGVKVKAWFNDEGYEVTELSGDRAVLRHNGDLFDAFHVSDLEVV